MRGQLALQVAPRTDVAGKVFLQQQTRKSGIGAVKFLPDAVQFGVIALVLAMLAPVEQYGESASQPERQAWIAHNGVEIGLMMPLLVAEKCVDLGVNGGRVPRQRHAQPGLDAINDAIPVAQQLIIADHDPPLATRKMFSIKHMT